MTQRRIKVVGVRRKEIDSDQLALVYWLLARRAVEEKRERDERDKKNRQEKTDQERPRARG